MRKYIPASYKNRTPSKELNNHLYLIEILKKLSKPNETYEKIVDGHTCTIYVTKKTNKDDIVTIVRNAKTENGVSRLKLNSPITL